MTGVPDWDKVFDRVEHCSLCGDSNFMCECDRHNVDDFDSYDDEDYE